MRPLKSVEQSCVSDLQRLGLSRLVTRHNRQRVPRAPARGPARLAGPNRCSSGGPKTTNTRPRVTWRTVLIASDSFCGEIGRIDEHAERLAALEPLHSPRHAIDRFQAANDRFQLQAGGQSSGRGGQTIRHMMVANDPRADRARLLRRRRARTSARSRMPLKHAGRDVGLGVQSICQTWAIRFRASSRGNDGRRR